MLSESILSTTGFFRNNVRWCVFIDHTAVLLKQSGKAFRSEAHLRPVGMEDQLMLRSEDLHA